MCTVTSEFRTSGSPQPPSQQWRRVKYLLALRQGVNHSWPLLLPRAIYCKPDLLHPFMSALQTCLLAPSVEMNNNV